MVVMPFFFARLGVKWMLAIGMLAWVLRYGLFAIGAPDELRWMIIIGIVLHGICYDFFFVTGQIYTDQKADKPIRAQAQGLLVMLTLGLGMMIGAQAAGYVEARYTPQAAKDYNAQVVVKGEEIKAITDQAEGSLSAEDQKKIDGLIKEKNKFRQDELASFEWKSMWGIPAIFAGVVMLIFVFIFNEKKKPIN